MLHRKFALFSSADRYFSHLQIQGVECADSDFLKTVFKQRTTPLFFFSKLRPTSATGIESRNKGSLQMKHLNDITAHKAAIAK
ncbi:hypothetical protein D3C77_555580 [compost metagenome]